MNCCSLVSLLTLLFMFMPEPTLYTMSQLGKISGKRPVKPISMQPMPMLEIKPAPQPQTPAPTPVTPPREIPTLISQSENMPLSPQKTALKELLVDFNTKFGSNVDPKIKQVLDELAGVKPLPTPTTASPTPPPVTTAPQVRPTPTPTPSAPPTALIPDLYSKKVEPLPKSPFAE